MKETLARVKRKAARVMAVLALLGGITGAGIAMAPSASAVSCYGDYCSGQDPAATGCSAGSVTVSATNVYMNYWLSQGHYVGYLELRWSPTCKTNWARFTPQAGFSYRVEAIQPETGYTQSWNAGPWQTAWTSQIYSPVKCVYARVVSTAWDYTGNAKTACI